ncbi:hypothetical protein [Nostoc sp. CCY0012]|uniref:hypothetical protein n=1 Tax=Nostoc sp. CCY0012 TaxID=1056123 RepID=UPI0039C6B43E
MLLSKYFMAFTTIAASFAISSPVLANDRDVLATTIPASACRPQNNVDDAKVALSNGAYVFTGSATGTVIFYCPLPINANTVSDMTNDNDISAYRVYYRDTDGIGTGSEITTRLVYRDAAGLNGVGSTWSSNVFNNANNRTQFVNLNHDVGSNRLYSFLVTMQRTNTSQNPAFSGIDFAFPAIP